MRTITDEQFEKLLDGYKYARKELEKHAKFQQFECDILKDGSMAQMPNDEMKECMNIDLCVAILASLPKQSAGEPSAYTHYPQTGSSDSTSPPQADRQRALEAFKNGFQGDEGDGYYFNYTWHIEDVDLIQTALTTPPAQQQEGVVAYLKRLQAQFETIHNIAQGAPDGRDGFTQEEAQKMEHAINEIYAYSEAGQEITYEALAAYRKGEKS